MTTRKQGRIRITYDLFRELLGLPEGVVISEIGINMPRQMIDVMYVPTTDKHIPGAYIFDVQEGSETPIGGYLDTTEINPVHYAIYEMVRNQLIGAVPDDEEDEPTC